MYRVTPFYDGNDLIAKGFELEALSVDDWGGGGAGGGGLEAFSVVDAVNGVMFNVYCYNVQPKLVIDYGEGVKLCQQKKQSILYAF